MKRRLFRQLSALSLLVFVLIIGLRIANFFGGDALFSWRGYDYGINRHRYTYFVLHDGWLAVNYFWEDHLDAPPLPKETLGWRLQLFRGPYSSGGSIAPGGLWSWHSGPMSASSGYFTLDVRLWPIIVVTAILPGVRIALAVLAWRRRRRQQEGLCPTCGYDVRATPERCPECGAELRMAARVNDRN